MLSSILRTVVISAIAVGMLLAAMYMLRDSQQARLIAELEAINADMTKRLAEKEAMLERLSRSRRVAHVHITDQIVDGTGQVTHTTFDFIELDDRGAELARQRFTIPGDILFIDTWTAKFSHEDVALGHPFRGRTLVLFRRVYSDRMAPRDGFPIDTPGAIPPGYAASAEGRLEQAIWKRFWEIAANPDVAREYGVRVAQGEVVYKPVRAGQSLELTVDAAGGLNLATLAPQERTFSQVR